MKQSEYKHRSHNVSVLLYHFVSPAKYRRVVFSVVVDGTLKGICMEISKRYPMHFLEIGTDRNHVHFSVAIDSDAKSDEDNNSDQEHYGTRDIPSTS